MAGIAAAVFLFLLDGATQIREGHHKLIWFLPVAGLFIGWVYHHYGKDVTGGNNLILDEIHDPQKIVPLKMGPLILLSTLFTHLFGGSAGREGSAVQMGATFSDQLSKFFKIDQEERKMLLVAGAGAGFAAAIGTPWAGLVFGMEVINIGKLKIFAWFECLVASYTGYYSVLLLGVSHSAYPNFIIPAFEWRSAFFVVIAGILFGSTARIFVQLTHFIETLMKRLITYPPLIPFCAGILLVGLYWLEGSYRYVGLGISFIQEALTLPSSFLDPLLKMLFSSLTIGSGFKGGEFIPLVFIGTTLGSALSLILPVSFKLLGALGFAAVFAGAANTPIACTLLCMEIFGYQIFPYAVLACFVSYYTSGYQGIYKSQKITMQKQGPFNFIIKRLLKVKE